MRKPTDTVKSAFLFPFKAIAYTIQFALIGWAFKRRTGSAFAKPSQMRGWLSAGNSGLLLDGKSARLSETESFRNVCVIARVGAGKTTRYIIPNVLDRAKQACSIVVNDPKGEVFVATSGAMARAGYRIIVIDPQHPEYSSRFNPLAEAHDDIELDQIAQIIINSGNPNAKDPFWNNGAMRLLAAVMKALRNASVSSSPGTCNLANAYRVLQNFGKSGSGLTTFMSRASIDPRNPADDRLWHEWKGVITGNPEGVQSFAMNALTALKALSNRNLAWITAQSDIDLTDLRRQRTVIYFITPPQLAHYYAFFTSIFFQSVFNAMMRQEPGKKDLPVYILYDEFGHSTLPAFTHIANTVRHYKVSLSIVLQSIAQLSLRYGPEAASTLSGGFSTIQTFAGSDPETAFYFEKLLGRVRESRRTTPLSNPNPQETRQEYNLLNADEVRQLGSDETLIVSTNRQPVRLTTVPYFANGVMARAAKIAPVAMPVRVADMNSVPMVRL